MVRACVLPDAGELIARPDLHAVGAADDLHAVRAAAVAEVAVGDLHPDRRAVVVAADREAPFIRRRGRAEPVEGVVVEEDVRGGHVRGRVDADQAGEPRVDEGHVAGAVGVDAVDRQPVEAQVADPRSEVRRDRRGGPGLRHERDHGRLRPPGEVPVAARGQVDDIAPLRRRVDAGEGGRRRVQIGRPRRARDCEQGAEEDERCNQSKERMRAGPGCGRVGVRRGHGCLSLCLVRGGRAHPWPTLQGERYRGWWRERRHVCAERHRMSARRGPFRPNGRRAAPGRSVDAGPSLRWTGQLSPKGFTRRTQSPSAGWRA